MKLKCWQDLVIFKYVYTQIQSKNQVLLFANLERGDNAFRF